MKDPKSIDSDIPLQEIDAQTAQEFLTETGRHKLPLPDQDRQEIERRMRKKKHTRLSLFEAMLVVTSICFLLGLSNLIRFEIYTLALGVTAMLSLFGFFNRLLDARYRTALIAILLISYITSVCWLVLRGEGWIQ